MKADLHIHTNFSDGAASPKEIVKAALEKNIDCICITDHGTIEGAIEAIRFGFDKNILVVPGIEITTKSGDILGINIKRKITCNPSLPSLKEAVEEIRKQEGLAIIAHPFDWMVTKFKGSNEELLIADAIEAFNARVLSSFNKKAFDFSQKYNLPFSAGSDAHRACFVGRAYLEIPKNIFSEKDLLEQIKEKRVEIKGKGLRPWEMMINTSMKGVVFFFQDLLRERKGRSK